ncbi:MAG: hypothetical protein ABFC89_02705 [Methanospirillum sp.]
MSHTSGGPQKYILEQVSEQGYCLLNTVKAPELSVSRAARQLAEKGLVVVCEFIMGVPDKRSASGRADRETRAAFPPGLTYAERMTIRMENGLMPGRESGALIG